MGCTQKTMLILSSLLLVAGFGLGYYWFFVKVPQQDIRPITWGVSKAAIKAREHGKFESESPDALIYRDTLLESIPAAIGYDFEDEALSGVKYVSLLKYKTFRDCLAVCQQLQNLVFEQYGKPDITTAETFREAAWQTAITSGSLKILHTAEERYIWILTFQPTQKGDA